jgi:hypothetical protein
MSRVHGLVGLCFLTGVGFAHSPALAQISQASAPCPTRESLDAAPAAIRSGDAAALAGFEQAPACHHWITFYYAAEAMFKAGRKDEAVGWFYVGQIRGRLMAQLGPNTSTPMVMPALQHVIGQPINGYAGGDLAKWVAAVDWAIAWDAQNPMSKDQLVSVGKSGPFGSTELSLSGSKPMVFENLPPPSQATFDKAYGEHREGIGKFRDQLAKTDPVAFAAQRKANGLD